MIAMTVSDTISFKWLKDGSNIDRIWVLFEGVAILFSTKID